MTFIQKILFLSLDQKLILELEPFLSHIIFFQFKLKVQGKLSFFFFFCIVFILLIKFVGSSKIEMCFLVFFAVNDLLLFVNNFISCFFVPFIFPSHLTSNFIYKIGID